MVTGSSASGETELFKNLMRHPVKIVLWSGISSSGTSIAQQDVPLHRPFFSLPVTVYGPSLQLVIVLGSTGSRGYASGGVPFRSGLIPPGCWIC
jgi:hypothetical protein